MYKRRSFSIVFRNYNHRDKARERGGGGEGGGRVHLYHSSVGVIAAGGRGREGMRLAGSSFPLAGEGRQVC